MANLAGEIEFYYALLGTVASTNRLLAACLRGARLSDELALFSPTSPCVKRPFAFRVA
jgi:hypothetical protein